MRITTARQHEQRDGFREFPFGGGTTLDVVAPTSGPRTFSNVNVSDNIVGFGQFMDFATSMAPAAIAANTVFDFTNPTYSARAWAAYLANGTQTTNLVTATPSETLIRAPSSGSTTLYGDGINQEHLFGGNNENIFIGGAGVQNFWGGSGTNIYKYLSVAIRRRKALTPSVISMCRRTASI